MAARSAHKLAIAHPRVTADVIEVTEYPELAQRHRIYAVPKTVINERVAIDGAIPEAVLVEHLREALGRPTPGEPVPKRAEPC